MTVAQVRAGLVTQLKTISALSSRSFPYAPDQLNPPSAFVGPMIIDPRAIYEGTPNIVVQVFVAVSGSSSFTRAVELLDPYIDGASSVLDALQSPSATAWDSLAVSEVEAPVAIPIGNPAEEFVGARFECQVFV